MTPVYKLLVFRMIALIFLSGFFGVKTNAQEEVTLRIGDKAPAIKYSKWIKGNPLESLQGDRLYVLEFWATWCGPCRAAMPHLSRLQKEYEGKVSIIGVDVWEDKKKGEPYEAYLPAVEKFVKQNDANMAYSLFADNNDQHMGTNWLKAAGQEGIPSTFIVKDETIIWIGHPMALDSTLPKILNGSYNMIAYKELLEKQVDESKDLIVKWIKVTKPIQEAIAAKEYNKAFDLIEKGKADYPDLKFALNRMKFYTLLKESTNDEAIKFGNTWHKEDKNAAGAILDAVSREMSLLKSTYLWAARIYNKVGNEDSPFTLHTLATAYAKGGDYKNAVIYESKAVTKASAALKAAETGAMTKQILNEYEQALNNYEKALKTTGTKK